MSIIICEYGRLSKYLCNTIFDFSHFELLSGIVFSQDNLKNCKIFAFAKICTFLVGYEKIRHKRAISFGCIVFYYYLWFDVYWKTSWYRTDLRLVIEWFKSVLSFSVEVQFNICIYWLILSSCRSHFLWFVHLCCDRIISKFLCTRPTIPRQGWVSYTQSNRHFIPYQDS